MNCPGRYAAHHICSARCRARCHGSLLTGNDASRFQMVGRSWIRVRRVLVDCVEWGQNDGRVVSDLQGTPSTRPLAHLQAQRSDRRPSASMRTSPLRSRAWQRPYLSSSWPISTQGGVSHVGGRAHAPGRLVLVSTSRAYRTRSTVVRVDACCKCILIEIPYQRFRKAHYLVHLLHSSLSESAEAPRLRCPCACIY